MYPPQTHTEQAKEQLCRQKGLFTDQEGKLASLSFLQLQRFCNSTVSQSPSLLPPGLLQPRFCALLWCWGDPRLGEGPLECGYSLEELALLTQFKETVGHELSCPGGQD